MAEINQLLSKFDIPDSSETQKFSLLRYECLSPDSFMWRVTDGRSIYYLYAEDYVSGLDHIKKIFTSYMESEDWKLVRNKQPINFSESEPVVSASTYEEPKDSAEMMQFAVSSGFDFVFLAQSTENAEDGLFSENAPRGFK